MGSLAIGGEPNGWLEIGYTASALAARLDDALSDADALGAQSVARSWSGPAAGAFTGDWPARRARYEELIDLARRAARAITEYGEALREVQEHARALEYTWCATGLVVSPLGVFDLPAGAALLPAPARLSLEHALAGALRDLESLATDVLASASDLVIGLGPVVALLEEFALARYGSDAITVWDHDIRPGLNKGFWVSTLGGAIPGVVKSLTVEFPVADRVMVSGLADVGDDLANGIVWGDQAWDVGDDAFHEGPLASLEQNSGGIVSAGVGTLGGIGVTALAGVVVAAGAPVVAGAAVLVGGALLVGIVGVGVGNVVQTEVDDHKKTINRDVDDVGHDISRDFDHDVVPEIENHIAPDIENAVGTGPA
jgi:hypothetical protein